MSLRSDDRIFISTTCWHQHVDTYSDWFVVTGTECIETCWRHMTISSDSKRKHFCGQELLQGKYFLDYYTLKPSTLFLKRHLSTFSALKLSQLKIKLIASFTYLIVVSFDEFFFLKHHLWPFLHYDFFQLKWHCDNT